MLIYVDLIEGDLIDAWGTSPLNDNSISVEIEDNHSFLEDIPNKYFLKDGKIKKSPKAEEIEMKYLREEKKEQLSTKCQQIIKDGFKFEGYHYSYGIENQQNFSDTMRLFDNNMIDSIGWNAYVNEEKVRIQLNKKEFTEVYHAGVQHKTNAISRLNDVLYPLVDAAENKETIARIYWDEGLPVEELSLKENKTIDNQFKELSKKDSSLEQSNTMTMLALVQLSSRLGKD